MNTRETIAKIIDQYAKINYEYGEDIYITNSEEIADRILDTIYEAIHIELGGVIHKPKPVDPDKMDAIGRKIGEIKQ